MAIKAPSSASYLVLTLEDFMATADSFIQNYYKTGSNAQDIQRMIAAITNLRLDINIEALEAEFKITLSKRI
ncbi:MAG: hypothetical protein HC836_32615 [Richelia sp. RM2_1_2]|nr:hypothetical protein [Richelia sp. SM2_1_7]NJM19970.1 hypothetical protein [Richelia sp. SM1_7_0]NJN13739.1 hypothetical protein [Richelia sp. RM1_1_1]NJO28884.1 hypothetical protein [Richelia sp. SL_2_1]NJO62798.1 hypothetical protein [Richelia sp. RM2_1_2]